MRIIVDMNPERVTGLRAVTAMLVDVDQTISQLLAVKEGLLALGSRLSIEIGEDTIAASEPILTGSAAADAVELAGRAVAGELAAAVRVSDRTLERRMGEADTKVAMFPAVWRAQGCGAITAGQAAAIVDAGFHIDDPEARDAYSQELIDGAQSTGLAPARLRRIAARTAERFQRRSIEDRQRSARARHSVRVRDRADGDAALEITGPAALIHGAHDRLTALAVTIHANAATRAETCDTRSLDQIRCDLALDLLLTGTAAGHDAEGLLTGIRGSISVTVPVTTLMGVTDMPAELNGRVPIDAATARRLAAAAPGWDRILTHPITGALLAVDRYRPTAEMKRWLRARDRRCRFPGCGYAAVDCDIDHTRDAAHGGPTETENLAHLCRRHHVAKHQTPWRVTRSGAGAFTWTSPTGRTYSDRPPSQNTVTFSGAAPPF
ncbi:DUF222 domain-containing protein [Microbacterium sp.]|uniref:HNH endonuclease signature motif containing protein n=1 Tax=Microbacterium sp. TaxID=51671 RepID=UPI0039E271A0